VQNEPPPALLWQSDASFYICHCTGLHSGFINNNDKSFTFDTIKNAVLQLFSFIQKEHVLCMRGDTLLLIIPENALIESTLAIEELCGRLLRYFDSFFLLPFYVVYSGVCDQSTVRHVYKQAENASRMRFYGQERIASISAADFTRLPPSLSVKAIGSQLLEYVKHNLPDEVVSTINSIASDLVKNRTEPAEIRKFFSDLLSYCHAVISRVYPVNIQAQQDDIASASYIQEIQIRAVKFLTNLPRIVGTDPDSYKKDVLKSISYIQQHYTERITTSTIAEHVQLSGNYLSKIFKEDTGISVTQYINMLKMEKALELLESKQNYVREVAETVGIPDQFYFNRLFKKYHGKSPSNYIKG
jgi:two-component system response regulator YesN